MLALVACADAAAPPLEPTTSRDSLGVTVTTTAARSVKETAPYAAVADTLFRLGAAGSADAEPLFDVRAAMFLEDTTLVVLHGGVELRLYDASGALAAVRGRRGEGPGEFMSATGLRSTGDGGLAVWDAVLGRVTRAAPDGTVRGTERADVDAIALRFPGLMALLPEYRWQLLDGDRLLLFDYDMSGPVPEDDAFRPGLHYVTTTLIGTAADTLGAYAGVEQVLLPASVGGGAVRSLDPEDTYYAVAEASGRLYVGDSETSRIDRYGGTGALEQRIMLDGVDRTPRPEVLTERAERLVEQLERRGAGDGPAVEAAVADLASDDATPAFRHLTTDDLGNLWVRWGRTAGTARELYAVFDSAGVLVGNVAMPRHARLLAVAHDRAAVLHTSELDVETVAVYRLERGP